MKVQTIPAKKNVFKKILSFMLLTVLIMSAVILVALSPLSVSAATKNIYFNTTYEDNLSSSNSSNLYYFDTTVRGYVSVKFETLTITESKSWRVSIIGVSDSKIYAAKDLGGTTSSSDSSRTEYVESLVLPAGRYYISVAVPSNVTMVMTNYKLTASFSTYDGSDTTQPSGPNNTIDTATAMNLNTTMTGNLRSKSDANYFKITVPDHGSLNLNFSVASSIDTGNWVILLYDKNEKQLQMSRVGLGGEIINQTRTNKLDKLRVPPGTYYIKIVPQSESSFSSADYKIYANYAPEKTSKFEKEFNDTYETATNLLINASVTGNLNDKNDRDYFKFNMGEPGEAWIEFSTPDDINQDMWTIYIQNAKGSINTYSAGKSGVAINGRRNFISENLTLEPGLHYIIIYSEAGVFSNSDYNMTLHSDTAPVPDTGDDNTTDFPTTVPTNPYNVNITHEGSVKSAGDSSTYDFGLNHNGSISVDFYSAQSVTKQAWILNIFDKNNKLLYSGKYGDEGVYNSSMAMRLTTSDKIRVPAGSYYVQVLPINAYDFSTTAYKLKINYSPESKTALNSERELFETEVNNTQYTANTLTVGSYLTANLSDSGDSDFYKFTLTQNGSAQILFMSDTAVKRNNWEVELYTEDSSSSPLYKDSFGADGEVDMQLLKFKLSGSNSIRLPAGTYYIKVSAPNIINYSNSDYMIKVGFTEERPGDTLYETEFNNTPQTANFLPFNEDIKGNIFDTSDIDYFKIAVSKENIDSAAENQEEAEIQIKFTVSDKVNANLWFIKVYDAAYKELKSYPVGAEGGNISDDGTKYYKTGEISLIPGDYFVSISPYTGAAVSGDEYTVRVLDNIGRKIEAYKYTADEPSKWAKYEVELAYAYNLVPQSYMKDFTSSIKREEFCMLVIKFLEVSENKSIQEILAENGKTINYSVFRDTQEYSILAANALGIVNGRGDGVFDPLGNITREEAATMLMRVGVLSKTVPNIEPLEFPDDFKFSSWAVDSIKYVSGCIDSRGNRIMNGYANGGFYPTDTYSREQAFMTIFRLFAIKAGI